MQSNGLVTKFIENFLNRTRVAVNSKEPLLLILWSHSALEYWLDLLIKVSFIEPKLILDENDLRSFYNKTVLLKSNGTIKNKEIFYNLKTINEIRNKFVHGSFDKENFDAAKIKGKIYSLKKIETGFVKEPIDNLGKKIHFSEKNPYGYFPFCALTTLGSLIKIYGSFGNENKI